MIKRVYLVICLFILSGSLKAQSMDDMVRYGFTKNVGTARSAAMGGAMGALGGDLGSVSINPASIAVFRRSEFNLSPTINVASTDSDGSRINNTSFKLGSMGTVVAIYDPKSPLRAINYGITYTNSNNFNRKTNQSIYDSPYSIMDTWALAANDGNAGYRQEMAEKTYLIFKDEKTGAYKAMLDDGDIVNQYRYIKESGYQGEYTFAIGTNYMDKLYVGATIGLGSFYYKYNSTYNEITPEDNEGLDQFFLRESLKSTGTGVNFGLGVIYRPVAELRLGASIKSPTYYYVSDTYDESIESFFFDADEEGNDNYFSFLDPSYYEYRMRSPWRTMFSVATVLNQKLILSADYEFTNYKSSRFSTDDGYNIYDNRGGVNDDIDSYLRNTHNLRVGIEYRLNPIISLRGGYALNGSPYEYVKDMKHETYSGGIGLNYNNFYCDMSYGYKTNGNRTMFYSYVNEKDNISAATIDNTFISHEAKVTVGFRF